MGAIVGDLNSRRGRDRFDGGTGSSQVIRATVRWGRCSDTQRKCGPMTQGRALHDAVLALEEVRPRSPKRSMAKVAGKPPGRAGSR